MGADGRRTLVALLVTIATGACLVGAAIWVARPPATGPGSLDPTFGDRGIAAVPYEPSVVGPAAPTALARQPDGRLLVAGQRGFDFALSRITADGRLDTGFGSHGTVRTDVGGMDAAWAVAVQADGRILVGGQLTELVGGPPFRYDFALVRYLPDGRPDLDFGNAGIVTTDIGANDDLRALAVQPDGRILAAGRTGASGTSIAVVRYLADGRLDPSFGERGVAVTDTRAEASVQAIALYPDGRIVVACGVVVRYAPDGRPDPSFGTDGVASTLRPGNPAAIAIQSDGGILVGGIVNGRLGLARLQVNGLTDGRFGVRGVVAITSGGSAGTPPAPRPDAVAFTADGGLLVGSGGEGALELERHAADGTLDATFDGDGIVRTGVGDDHARVAGITLQPDGRIVVAAYRVHESCGIFANCGSTATLVLARYLGG